MTTTNDLPTCEEFLAHGRGAPGRATPERARKLAEAHRTAGLAVLDRVERAGRGNLLASEQRIVDRHTAEAQAFTDAAFELGARDRAAEPVRREFANVLTVSPNGDEWGRQGGPGSDGDVRSFLRGDGRRTLDVRPPAGFETRDLVTGTPGAGGNVVPTSFYGQLHQHLIDTASLMANCTLLTTESGEDLQVPKTTAHSTATLIAEGGTITESDPAFGQVTLESFKYGIQIQVSRELVEDSGVDLTGYLAEQCGRALGNAAGAHFVTGDGSGKPRGVITGATVGVTGALSVAGAFTAGNLIDLRHSVIPPYRASKNCVWVMDDGTWGRVRKLKDADNNYLVGPLAMDADPMLLGHRVVIDTNVPDVAVGAKSVVFGDLNAYYVRMVRGVRFERSDDFAFDRDLVTFRALLRIDGDLVDELGAVKVFQGGAS